MRLARALVLLVTACAGCDRALALPDWTYDDTISCDGGACACVGQLADCDGTPANGCETALDTSADHCGACFHSCFGGTCAGGACAPAVLRDVSDFGGSGLGVTLAATGDALYFTMFDGTGVGPAYYGRVPTGESLAPWSAEILYLLSSGDDFGTFALDVEGARVTGVYLTGPDSLLHLPLDPSAGVTKAADLQPPGALQMVMGGRCVYLDDHPGGDVSQAPSLGVVDPEAHTSKIGSRELRALAGDGRRVAYALAPLPGAQADDVYVADGCGKERPVSLLSCNAEHGQVLALAVDAATEDVYIAVAANQGMTLCRTTDPGGVVAAKLTEIGGSFALAPPVLTAADGELYWVSPHESTIERLWGTGSAVHHDVIVTGLVGTVSMLAVDARRIYWADGTRLTGLARPLQK